MKSESFFVIAQSNKALAADRNQQPLIDNLPHDAVVSRPLKASVRRHYLMNESRITIVDAADRLSNRSYTDGEDSKADWRSVYTCPDCRTQVAFTADDFDQHAFSEESNLSPSDANEVGVASQAFSLGQNKGVNFKSFVDFYCEGCRGGVRIYYDAWGGGRFTHGYYSQFIIEKRGA